MDIFVIMLLQIYGNEPPYMEEVRAFLRLILPQGGACACVIYIRITMVTAHVHAPPCNKISLVTLQIADRHQIFQLLEFL